jgi:hypothetical protein
MPERGPDRALRMAIADLAAMRPGDRQAILDLLDPATRLQVQALLDERVAGQPRAVTATGLSPWLQDKISQGSGITAEVRAMLVSAAQLLAAPDETPVVGVAPSLANRFRSHVMGTGRI